MTATATKVRTTVNHAGVRTIALDDPDRRNALSKTVSGKIRRAELCGRLQGRAMEVTR
jgi:enoyl-CoA hydratase/carnithine racemase